MNAIEYEIMRTYNELNILQQNNIKGRYDQQIKEKKNILDELLEKESKR